MSSNAENRDRRSTTMLRRRRRGQGLVELALVLPFLLVLTLGIVDVGVLIADRYNVLYSTREAARVGSANACFYDDTTVLQRVASGLRNKAVSDIGHVFVFKANPDGTMAAFQEYNIITATVNGFSYTVVTNNWPYTVRHNNINYLAATKPGDWLGVKVNYTHHPITLIGQAFWGPSIAGAEKTIMRIEPPEKADGTTDCLG
jgi:Flp pilus assembly protein TadG